MIAVGDIVEVRQMANHGDERWVGARVIGLTMAHIEVEIFQGTFDDCHTQMALELRGRGEQWRVP